MEGSFFNIRKVGQEYPESDLYRKVGQEYPESDLRMILVIIS